MGRGVPTDQVEYVRETLAEFYDMSVVTLPRIEMPREAFYSPRNRYRAEILLAYLRDHQPEGGFRIVGLTDQDISTTRGESPDWGVIGLAMLGGPSCVVSSARCGLAGSNAARGRIRLAKAAVHEVGHNLGLSHCASPGCLMNDAKGRALTVDGEYDLCSTCRGILDRDGPSLHADRTIPWPQPEGTMPEAHLVNSSVSNGDVHSTRISRD
jgi:archaemetzincin